MSAAHDSSPMVLGEALMRATRQLAAAGVAQPRREARLLAAFVLGVPATALLDPGKPVDGAALGRLTARRAAGEPYALITGKGAFWTLDLAVSRDTLLPRADSESLIEAALAAVPRRAAIRRILDLGTGTGCLLLAALSEFSGAFGVGVDLSAASARLAAGNAASCGLADRSAFLAGNWAASIGGRFDLILCNPPYIVSADLAGLMPEVRLHEPARALDGGVDGLRAYAAILPAITDLMSPAGIAVFELGAGQSANVERIAATAGLTVVTTGRDLAGIARAMVLRKNSLAPR